jgi:multiple sugar transport system substrate-binding protein
VGGDETEAVLGRYRPWVANIIRLGDKLGGLPFALSTPIMYYNRDLMVQAGLDANPSMVNWDDVKTIAAALRDAGVEAPVVAEVNEWTAQTFIQNNGGRVLDDTGKAVFDSEEAIGGMATWTDLVASQVYMTMANDQARPSFLAGNAAMYFTSVAGLPAIRDNASFDLGTAQFPATGDKPKLMPSAGNFLGVYTKDAEQQQACWAFLKFVSSTEGVTIWNESGYMTATTDEVEMLPGQEPAYEQMEAGLTNETIWPGPRGLEAMRVFVDWMTRIINGEVSVEDGMVEGKAAVAELLP